MKYFLPILLLCFACISYAQQPTQDTKLRAYYQQQFTESIKRQLDKIDWSHVQRTTGNDTVLYTIPVVVHVLHEYAMGWLPDTTIIDCIDSVNKFLLKQDADTTLIIDKYKSVAASTQIRLQLATIDPAGNPTKGIDRIYTYLTHLATNQSKLNLWPPDRYLNFWTASELMYNSYIPSTPAEMQQTPYYDGMLCSSINFSDYPQYVTQFFCRYLGLPSPCSYNIYDTCGDNDLIPDTPPCSNGELFSTNIYDTVCDTPNMQNIMFDNGLGIMLTYGQGQYMQSVLQQSMAQRDSLVTPTTQRLTGIGQAMPDVPPTADFYTAIPQFYWPGQQIIFRNYSWDDTITASHWAFSSSAATASSNDFNVNNQFSTPGWDSATLTVTGNNTGQASATKQFFIADTNATNAQGYYEEFNPGGDIDKWPTFNYYNNNYKWQTANVGYYDNTSMEYHVYDTRNTLAMYIGTSNGDMDDMISPVFDLSGFTGNCSLIFYSSGAYREPSNIFFDNFEISYTTNGLIWTKLKSFTRDSIDNKGLQIQDYIPQSPADWKLQSIPLPANALKKKVAFRFSYFPGADTMPFISPTVIDFNNGYSASNNFYIDRISFSPYPAGVNSVATAVASVNVYPNPAAAFVDVTISEPQAIGSYLITITDVAGKEIYQQQGESADAVANVRIPLKPASGLYMVSVKTSRQVVTKKLMVN